MEPIKRAPTAILESCDRYPRFLARIGALWLVLGGSHDALTAFDNRAAARVANASHDAFEREQKQRRALEHMLAGQRDTTQAISDFVTRTPPAEESAIVTRPQIEADRPPIPMTAVR